jgi:hypothetical protein
MNYHIFKFIYHCLNKNLIIEERKLIEIIVVSKKKHHFKMNIAQSISARSSNETASTEKSLNWSLEGVEALNFRKISFKFLFTIKKYRLKVFKKYSNTFYKKVFEY